MNESAARPSHGPENAVEFPPIRVFVVDRSKQTVLECWPEFGSVLNQDAERYIRRMSRGGAMAKDFRPNAREFAVITRLDHAKEAQRSKAFHLLRQHMDELSNLVAMKLIAGRGKDNLDLITLLQSGEVDVPKARRIIKRLLGAYAAMNFDTRVAEAEWLATRKGDE